MNTKKLTERTVSSPLPRLLLLALFFFGGAVLGQVLAGRVPDNTGGELRRYLEEYVRLEGDPPALAVLSATVVYLR